MEIDTELAVCALIRFQRWSLQRVCSKPQPTDSHKHDGATQCIVEGSRLLAIPVVWRSASDACSKPHVRYRPHATYAQTQHCELLICV